MSTYGLDQRRELVEELKDYVGEFEGDFDLDAVADDIIADYPDAGSLDDLHGDVCLGDYLERHDVTQDA